MTRERITSAAFTALVGIIGWAWSVSVTYGDLPKRVTEVEQQQKSQSATLSKMEGQLDFIVDYVKRGRK